MTDRVLPHLRVRGTVQPIDGFIERRGFNPDYVPPPFAGGDKRQHVEKLSQQVRSAVNAEEREAGNRITFESFPGINLALEKLETRRSGPQPRLDSIRSEMRDGRLVEIATVFIPPQKRSYFLNKLTEYERSLGRNSNPSNSSMVESIQSARVSLLKDLWTDPPSLFPPPHSQVWWEVWLIDPHGARINELRAKARSLNLELGTLSLGFGPHSITLLRARREELALLDSFLDHIAELRLPASRIELIAGESNRNQAVWADTLLERMEDRRSPNHARVCILDHIVNRSHPLLQQFVGPQDVRSAIPGWSSFSQCGHGTEMAALALYHDLEAAMSSSSLVQIEHGLESVKVLPAEGDHPPDQPLLYGGVIALAVDAVELEDSERRRVFSLAVTAPHQDSNTPTDTSYLGNPTSWSATIDALAAGRQIDATADQFLYLDREDEDYRRLFVVAAGNIRDRRLHVDYPDRNDIEIVEDPGQAWNCITVGAFTNKDVLDIDGTHGSWRPIAARGQLSPSSRTSVAFDTQKWPVKPDVVAEGGNSAIDSLNSEVDSPVELQVLTTRHNWELRGQFTTTADSSAATASVAAIAATVWSRYPEFWPETVRGLVVHSAQWTPAMLREFQQSSRRDYRINLHRRFGMGVPDLGRALYSAQDSLTLIAEDRIRPFRWSNPERAEHDGIIAGMNLHTLPWPIEALESLGEAQVKLRVTLSYFIEPNASARGWRGRYAYPSFGLRFRVKHALETAVEFNKRINRVATEQGEEVPRSSEDSSRWWFGSQHQRSPGSLHTDIWTGTAAELASRGVIAVYPVGGWWKNNMKEPSQEAREARYSLIVSVDAADVDVDIWTPVANEIESVIEI